MMADGRGCRNMHEITPRGKLEWRSLIYSVSMQHLKSEDRKPAVQCETARGGGGAAANKTKVG